jgi:hypothetical protein
LVHFYDHVSTEELYVICSEVTDDVLPVAYYLRDWVANHPEIVDQTL